MSGYESDIDLNDVNFVGDFPLQNNVGDYGVATGTNDYLLVLDPPLTSLRIGMELKVAFQNPNTTIGTLDTNGTGAKPLKKMVAGVKTDIAAGNLSNKICIILWDGVDYVITNINDAVLPASESQIGISRFANDVEIDNGLADDLAVSSKQLTRFVADKITGLWDDQGLIDASINPNYPAGVKGDAYTFSAAGKIGGAAGTDVEVRDVLYCINDNAGGDEVAVGADWNIIQANIDQATDLIAGIIRISTTPEALTGALNNVAITPKTLNDVLAAVILQATQVVVGTSRFATSPETLAGLLTNVGISPATLKVALDNYLNRETQLSIAAIDMNPAVYTTPGRNRYVSVNGNLIMGKDIRLKAAITIPATFNFVHILNFPKPLNTPTPHQPTMLLSNLGNAFSLNIDFEGRVFLSGTFGAANEELILNLTPYLARFPLEYNGLQPPST